MGNYDSALQQAMRQFGTAKWFMVCLIVFDEMENTWLIRWVAPQDVSGHRKGEMS